MRRFIAFIVTLICLTTVAHAQAVPPEYFGLTIGEMTGVRPHIPIGTSRVWDAHYSTRTLYWKNIETARGVYSFADLDAAITAYKAMGVTHVVYTLGYVPGWANSNAGDNVLPTDFNDLYDFVTALITHAASTYGAGYLYLEDWNEPYYSTYCACTVANINTIAQNIYPIVKAIDPTALVLCCANVLDGETWDGTFFANGGGAYIDVYSIHAYPITTPPQPPEGVFNIVTYANQRLATYSLSKPIWVTEFAQTGVANDSAAPNTAVYTSIAMIAPFASGAERAIWYYWNNGLSQNGIGALAGSNQGLNDAGSVYRAITSWLLNSTFTSAIARQPGANGIRNTTMTGAVAGTPGTPPTNWSVSNPDVAKGMATTIVGTGTVGGVTYLDWRVHGTATAGASGYVQIILETTTHIAATNLQYWTFGLNLSIPSGSLANVLNNVNVNLSEYNSGGGGEVDQNYQQFIPTSLSVDQQKFWYTSQITGGAPIAFVQPVITIGYLVGDAIDITLRIALPLMDNGSVYKGTLTRSGGQASIIAWDVANGANGNQTVTTTNACGGATCNYWRDIFGSLHNVSGSSVLLGRSPIILDTAAQAVRFNYLLKRDLRHDNDNTPAGLEKVA